MKMITSSKQTRWILVLALFPLTSLFAELQTIYLRNGQIFRGEVLQQTATSMQIKTEDGSIRQLNKKDIQRVSYKEPTAKEKKEAEEKTKQEPLPPSISETPPPPKEEPKPAYTFLIDQLQRKDLEIFASIGAGRYEPDTFAFPNRLQGKLSLLNGQPGTNIDKPTFKPGLSDSYGMNYTWKRLSFGLSMTQFRNSTSVRFKEYNSSTDYSELTGNYPEKQNMTKADLALLVFTNRVFDLRPAIGYQQFFSKADDPNTILQSYSLSSLNAVGNYDQKFTEILKGTSMGLKATIRMGERWENRIELHSLSLSGEQHANISVVFAPATAPIFSFAKVAQDVNWKANGLHFAYKLVFRYTPTISFFAGVQAFEWKYSLTSMSQDTSSTGTPPTISEAVLQNLTIEAAGKASTTGSKSAILEFGLIKRFDFNR